MQRRSRPIYPSVSGFWHPARSLQDESAMRGVVPAAMRGALPAAAQQQQLTRFPLIFVSEMFRMLPKGV